MVVTTNDKSHLRQDLVVTGRVESLADMSASEINLDGKAGTPIRREITIRETKKYPFSVTGIGARDGRFITYRIRPVPNTHPKVMVLTVVNRKSTPGRFFDTIYIQTDSKVKKRISVPVIGNIH